MHKHPIFKSILSLAALSAAFGVAAQQDLMQDQSSHTTVDSRALARAQAKFHHAVQVAARFDAQARAEGLANDNWRFAMIANLMKSPEQEFIQVETAHNVAAALGAAARIANDTNPSVSLAKSLGSASSDLSYVPINPCRILDTRAGAIVASGVPRDFNYDAVNVGSAACSVASSIPGGAYIPAAIAVNVTIDDTLVSGIATGSYLAAYPQGGTPGSSFVNFGSGQVIANAGVIAINQSNGNFTVTTNAPAQVIADVYGVFVPPQASTLDCTTATNAGSFSPVSLTGTVSVSCPAGYSLVSGGCDGTALTGILTGSFQSAANTYTCSYGVLGLLATLTGSATAHATCCRLPGR